DDFELPTIVRPGSAAEVGDLVRRAAAEGQALYPLGGRTMLGLGLPPARPGYGVDLRSLNRVIDYPARDMTITVQAGITLAELQEVKAGGRVVKNVAGYDLCKLHIGALGTLGVITQVTLKVRPVPEAQVLVTLGCEPDALGPLLDQLHETRTRPVCLDVLNGP